MQASLSDKCWEEGPDPITNEGIFNRIIQKFDTKIHKTKHFIEILE